MSRAHRLHARRQAVDQQQAGVPAGDEQRDGRFGQRAVLERVHRDVRREMVDPVDRLVGGERVRLRRRHADQQGTGEPRAGGDRDRVQVGEGHPGGVERPPHGRGHRLQVRPAGHLRDDPAEAGVLVHAGGHRVGQQGVAAHDAHAGLVAGRLDAEHQRLRLHGNSSRIMTRASVLLGW